MCRSAVAASAAGRRSAEPPAAGRRPQATGRRRVRRRRGRARSLGGWRWVGTGPRCVRISATPSMRAWRRAPRGSAPPAVRRSVSSRHGLPRAAGGAAPRHAASQSFPSRRRRTTLDGARRTAAAGETSRRGKSGHHRARWSAQADPVKAAGKCHRDIPPMAGRSRPAQARVKRCGKSAPASWRHGGQANPTGCKAKQDRLQVARQGPGRPLRWMVVHDKIRLIGVLRRGPLHGALASGPHGNVHRKSRPANVPATH